MGDVFNAYLVAAAIRMATPLILVALAAAISLKAGIFNIAVEGVMLWAAFVAVVVATASGSVLLAVLASCVACVLLSIGQGYVMIRLGADQIIAGLGINLLAAGVTAWMLGTVLDSPSGYGSSVTPTLPILSMNWLKSLPVVGTILDGHHVLTWATLGIIVATYYLVHRSAPGLRLRATGEAPEAARNSGIDPDRQQYVALALTGVLCGLAGATLSIGNLGLFTKGMTAGRGFIGFAAASFALGNIRGTAFMALLFALGTSVAIRAEGFGIPSRLVQTFPYVATVIALTVSAIRKRRS